jgi:hypothetical protein
LIWRIGRVGLLRSLFLSLPPGHFLFRFFQALNFLLPFLEIVLTLLLSSFHLPVGYALHKQRGSLFTMHFFKKNPQDLS